MFKIVQTVEKGRTELTIVPAKWENNGMLFWPKKFAHKLQRDPETTPDLNWLTMSCKLKRNYIASYEVAQEELERMLEAEDTEQEQQLTPAPQKRTRSLLPTNTKSTLYDVDFNNVADSCIVFSNKENEPPIEAEGENYKDPEPNLQTYNVIYPGQTIEFESIATPVENDNSKLDKVLTVLDTVVQNQQKILMEFAHFKVVFETFLKRAERNNAPTSRKTTIVPFEPIDCLEDLKTFNDKLNNNETFNEYVETLSFICGRNTKTKGIDHCYMLVDKCFARKFFTLCSWAGGAKGPNTKFPFKFYENVITLFFKLVNLADPAFTLGDCEDFFKSVIRNSLRRSISLKARTSKSKKRPKKLSYSIKIGAIVDKEQNEASDKNTDDSDDDVTQENEVS